MQKNTQQTGGWTLIETIIVIGIMAIIATAGFYSLLGFHSSQQLDDEAKSLVAVLKSAQEKSIGEDSGSRWGVFLITTSDRDSYYLYQVDEGLLSSGGYDLVPGSSIDQRTMSGTFKLQLPDLTQNTSTIIFSKDTGLPNTSTTIWISLRNTPSTRRGVLISGNGKIDYQ